jgi:hypothetical protein
MNKKEIQTKVRELLATGVSKSEVFRQLSGQGIKDYQLALFIASYVDPTRSDKHNGKVNALITLMFVHALIAFILGFFIGAKLGPNARWIIGGLVASIPLLFAWGFYKHQAAFYNAYILLTIVQIPRSLESFTASPVATSIALSLNFAVLAYVWYVRNQIFPDFAFITPKKVKGEYVFSG